MILKSENPEFEGQKQSSGETLIPCGWSKETISDRLSRGCSYVVRHNDGFYALAMADPKLWQFRDHQGQLWCFLALPMKAMFSPAWFHLLMDMFIGATFSPAWFQMLMDVFRWISRRRGIRMILYVVDLQLLGHPRIIMKQK
ncbi:hypothetical protein SARC_13534 [Sphaeroforma arctica JP610]|uniref:Uncharacterized protein n=1 Tax=Sphaeroforma arctica JP610 TaxID=667725 RepID=A0A0L0FB22_9EUKA|nr:hypothetical protein SARC_13534 [Sphaeroforma arctica JP610]KNC73907.1 hypothetical protein SARC_13534 [Sphaeroforma arctica JP610]|eukprot:XP_014147809.1 hypothetical protein SARC_13534 [Sphaeroforma arctica JP610]